MTQPQDPGTVALTGEPAAILLLAAILADSVVDWSEDEQRELDRILDEIDSQGALEPEEAQEEGSEDGEEGSEDAESKQD